MSSLLLKIDDLVRCDHSFLDENDECYYFHEFIARGGYEASDSNSLISNFKKDVGRRHLPEWKYKEVAINRISELLIETVPSFLKNKDTTFVPIPPSKTKCNPEYDDRLIQVLFKYKQKYSDANLKELLFIKQDVIAVHTSSRKRDVNALFQNLGIDKKACADITKNVVLFDDVITTGAHFKACKRAIEHIPGVERVIGIFVARRSVMATIQYEFKDLFGSDR